MNDELKRYPGTSEAGQPPPAEIKAQPGGAEEAREAVKRQARRARRRAAALARAHKTGLKLRAQKRKQQTRQAYRDFVPPRRPEYEENRAHTVSETAPVRSRILPEQRPEERDTYLHREERRRRVPLDSSGKELPEPEISVMEAAGYPIEREPRAGRIFFSLIMLCGCVAFILWGVGVWLFGGADRVEVDTGWGESAAAQTSQLELFSPEGTTNVLLLGIDGDGGEQQRSDTMMLISVTDEGSISLVSILRDTYIEIPGHGESRINHAYAYGGAALSMQTIEHNLRVEVRRYVSVDVQSASELIDSIGGAELELTAAEASHMNKKLGTSLEAGANTLDGEQAVFYARIRKLDSDFGRTSRQRKLLDSLLKRVRSLEMNEQITVIRSGCSCITTNLSNRELALLAQRILRAKDDEVRQLSIPAEGAYTDAKISSMAVLVPELEENALRLRDFLGVQ